MLPALAFVAGLVARSLVTRTLGAMASGYYLGHDIGAGLGARKAPKADATPSTSPGVLRDPVAVGERAGVESAGSRIDEWHLGSIRGAAVAVANGDRDT